MYRDEGYSGSWIEKRPAFSTLLKDAARRRFDAVVVTDFDRLTRPDNLKDLGSIQEVFIKHDIKIVTLSDVIDLSDDDQWFLSSLLGIVAAKEKKKLVARMKRGIQAKKEAGGFYGGIPPSGYCWNGEGKLKIRVLDRQNAINELMNCVLRVVGYENGGPMWTAASNLWQLWLITQRASTTWSSRFRDS